MHEKLLGGSAGDIIRRRHHSHPVRSHIRIGRDGFGIYQEDVGKFESGTLDAEGETRLADEVAALLPQSWDLPNKGAASLQRVIDQLGGQQQLMEWLDRHPGRPRLTARIYVFLGLLDHYSNDSAVLAAVLASRQKELFPEGLQGYLLPQTDDETLCSLAYRIEELLGADLEEQAADLALATSDWLRRAAGEADGAPPAVAEFGTLMGHAHDDIAQAVDRS